MVGSTNMCNQSANGFNCEAKVNTTPKQAWIGLTLGVTSQGASAIFLSTPAFLIPLLHEHRGLPLAEAGLIAAAPNLGIVMTLVAWGAITDRFGERKAMVLGLLLTALCALGATLAHGYTMISLFSMLGGMAAGSTSSASGKVVMGWFPTHRRGLAMGIRQMSQPLGVTLTALIVPSLAKYSISEAFLLALGFNGVLSIACWIGIRNPPRSEYSTIPKNGSNPYRKSNFLWRIHSVSALLVVPQYTVATFGLVWLETRLHYGEVIAGVLVAVSQFTGAIGRIGVGVFSDRVKSRVRPLRWVTLSAVAIMLMLSLSDLSGLRIAGLVLIVAAVVTVADNGLAFTSVAEAAGQTWSGRALGIQNTGQFVTATAVPPVIGALIGAAGYPWAFLVVALCPVMAFPIIPIKDASPADQ